MSDKIENLWPESFQEVEVLPVPYEILKEQGKLLKEKTNGKIEGIARVSTLLVESNKKYNRLITFSFYVPNIKYEYQVLHIECGLSYPARIMYDYEGHSYPHPNINYAIASDDKSFKTILKGVFASVPIAKIIATLIQASKDHRKDLT